MNMNTDIRISINSAIIILVAACILIFGIRYHDNKDTLDIRKMVSNTQDIFTQIGNAGMTFPPQVADAFIKEGWDDIRIPQAPVAPILPQTKAKEDSTKGD